ncbi:MAG: elongation factor 4, partial [Planctomycetes bacterium]|nr:elongation factor 4 [Planctomycetota bacterium]
MRIEKIRNFCIIAHIDHGKSTLADRMLLKAGAITQREFREQILDTMDLERERGITIKSSCVSLKYERDGKEYMLNLIDTPGHVDFSYEVSRSLAACEGALLLVDATQGVEAQTVANNFLAMQHDLAIVPIVNKLDLASARPDEVIEEMEHSLAVEPQDVLRVSAKDGSGVDAVFDAIIDSIPPPEGDPGEPLQALVFDSEYDEYCGVVLYARVMNGTMRVGDKIRMMNTGRTAEVSRLGLFTPKMEDRKELSAGEVGYVIANIKSIHDVDVGDTITAAKAQGVPALKGYVQPQPMVFCGFYPANDCEFSALRNALDRLSLNDSSFWFEPETSDALGFGFRCGFLGMLHMEIVQE